MHESKRFLVQWKILQTKRIAVGNPLSPFLVEVFMSKFELDNKQTQTKFPKLWLRYVDNILAIIKENFDKEAFFENLNCQNSTIKLYNKNIYKYLYT